MKFTKDHYKLIKDRFINLGIDAIIEHQAYCLLNNYSKTRFVWGVYWEAEDENSRLDTSNYSDIHIETAITTAIKELLKDKYLY